MVVYFKDSMLKYCVYNNASRKVMIKGFFRTRKEAENFIKLSKINLTN